MSDVLSELRSDPGIPARVGSRLFKGVREVESTRRPYAAWWEAANREALEAAGPLWLVLGDSASQSIGASSPEAGYVIAVRDRLDASTGERWRVVNLSITGAKMIDVVDRQLPVVEALGLGPDLVTSFIGANDLLYPWGIDDARRDADRLARALPEGTLQSRMVGGPPSKPKASAINGVLESAAEGGALSLFHPWDWPTTRGVWAADRFHPSDIGYGHLTESVWRAVEPAVT